MAGVLKELKRFLLEKTRSCIFPHFRLIFPNLIIFDFLQKYLEFWWKKSHFEGIMQLYTHSTQVSHLSFIRKTKVFEKKQLFCQKTYFYKCFGNFTF